MCSLILTAFGPFDNHIVNPSEKLLNHFTQYQQHILPVSYKAVDDFIQNNAFTNNNRVLMFGVSDAIKKICIEKTARNQLSGKPDISYLRMKPGKIQDNVPMSIRSSLFKGWRRNRYWDTSNDAGNYLCNYLYYRMLSSLPKVQAGFVHVPPFCVLSENEQVIIIRKLISKLEVAN
jgi:pyrrolidone-carboxylate peptidase